MIENINTAKKHTANMVNNSFPINRFVKPEDNINTFFISIIGPNTRNPIIAPIGNWLEKLRAITASDEEHRDSAKAIIIITAVDTARFVPL